MRNEHYLDDSWKKVDDSCFEKGRYRITWSDHFRQTIVSEDRESIYCIAGNCPNSAMVARDLVHYRMLMDETEKTKRELEAAPLKNTTALESIAASLEQIANPRYEIDYATKTIRKIGAMTDDAWRNMFAPLVTAGAKIDPNGEHTLAECAAIGNGLDPAFQAYAASIAPVKPLPPHLSPENFADFMERPKPSRREVDGGHEQMTTIHAQSLMAQIRKPQ